MAKSERELIRRIAPLCRGGPGAPFGDDLAELGDGLLWSCDMLMDGVDFDGRVHDWQAIGRKAMAVNLSDCAAMGVRPVGALCAVALNDALTLERATELLRGVADCGAQYGCPLRGGDTNSWPHPTVISVTVAGRPDAAGRIVRRDGARAGDGVYLSGPVGGSLLGRHMTFEPRVELGLRIAAELSPHAMIDISDGLALDLWRICEASGCGAVIDGGALAGVIHPDAVARAAQTGRPAREHALSDGEDFELLVALAPVAGSTAGVPADAQAGQSGLVRIGEFIAERRLQIREADAGLAPLEPAGWEHFR